MKMPNHPVADAVFAIILAVGVFLIALAIQGKL